LISSSLKYGFKFGTENSVNQSSSVLSHTHTNTTPISKNVALSSLLA